VAKTVEEKTRKSQALCDSEEYSIQSTQWPKEELTAKPVWRIVEKIVNYSVEENYRQWRKNCDDLLAERLFIDLLLCD